MWASFLSFHWDYIQFFFHQQLKFHPLQRGEMPWKLNTPSNYRIGSLRVNSILVDYLRLLGCFVKNQSWIVLDCHFAIERMFGMFQQGENLTMEAFPNVANFPYWISVWLNSMKRQVLSLKRSLGYVKGVLETLKYIISATVFIFAGS